MRLALLLHNTTNTRNMNAHPNAMSKISHHANLTIFVPVVTGCVRPLIVGNGVPFVLVVGTVTRSEKQIPKLLTTPVDPLHAEATHVPPRKTCSELHDRHSLFADPEQLAQDESHC